MNIKLGLAALLCAASVSAAAFAADPQAGKQVAGMCAVCHGIDGIAKVPDAPHLAGESVQYLIRQLTAFKSGERKHEQMSIIAQGLAEDDMQNVAAWYSSIRIRVELPQ